MKKETRMSLALRLLLPLLLVCLVVPTAHADIGPKPTLTITVVNAPEGEDLYVDLLAQRGPATLGPQSEEDMPDYLKQLHSLEGDGWVLAVSTGYSVPVFGQINRVRYDGGNPVYHFSYSGLPSEFKVAAATAEEVRTSELFTRERFNSNVVYDWETGALTYVTPTPLYWAAQLAATLIPTLVVEGVVLYLFGYRERRSWLVFLAVNLVTQIGLHLACNLLMGSSVMNMSVVWLFYLFLLIPEVVIWCVEAAVYACLLRERDFTRQRAVGYAFAANIVSYALTFLPLQLLYEPFTRL